VDAAGPDWRILGGPDNGTYAELVKVPAENVFPKPARFSWGEAATFPLAGLTAYRAFFTVANLQSGETVLVLGAGGGVATCARARCRGRRPLHGGRLGRGDSRADRRPRRRRRPGLGRLNVGRLAAHAQASGKARRLRRDGRADGRAHTRFVYLNWLRVLGTAMGSGDDFAALLRMVEDGSWRPVVDGTRLLSEAEAAHERIKGSEHFGKLVLAVR
jgi:zinc-binding alcohol dehydrogenase/oxidoreductase